MYQQIGNKMKLSAHPKTGDIVNNGFIVNKIVRRTLMQSVNYFLCVEKGEDKRMLRYNPRLKEVSNSFERHSSSFGGTSKGNYKTW